MLDFALGLNALLCFAALLFPVFGYLKGRRGQINILKRAQNILLSLLALLMSNIVMLHIMAIPDEAEALADLRRYAVWSGLALLVGLGLGRALYAYADSNAQK